MRYFRMAAIRKWSRHHEISPVKSASIQQPHWHCHLDVKRPTHRVGGPGHKDGTATNRPSGFPDPGAFPGSNPTAQPITSGLPVKR